MNGTIRQVSNLMVMVAGLTSAAGLWWQPLAQETEPVPGWSVTGGLSTIRSGYTATLLPNGKVLVAGGEELLLAIGGSEWVTNKAELYDPATGVWSPTGNLTWGRVLHTATLLPNGKVLVVGGWDGSDQVAFEAELYDPVTGTWSVTGDPFEPGWVGIYHTATLLPNGKVLIVGDGYGPVTYFAAGLYDPATETFRAIAGPRTRRGDHTATLLPNGRVLIAGGASSDTGPFFEYPISTELYDPATGIWTISGSLSTGRTGHTATVLPDGKVLIAGGYRGGDSFTVLNSAELYDPSTETSSPTGSLIRAGSPDNPHDTARLLPNDKVLFVSTGYGAELYDPTTRLWSRTADLKFGGFLETVTLLTNGKVLVTGNRFDGTTPMGELYAPSPASTIFVPIVLSSAGATGAFYSSEVLLANRSTRDATVEFTYNSALGGGSGMTTDFLGAGKQQIIPDAIAYLRQRGIPIPGSGNRAGTLRVRFNGLSSPEEAAVLVRTSTDVPDGRAGLAYSGLPPNALLDGPVHLFGLRQNGSDRTNVALENVGTFQGFISLSVTVYSGDASAPFSRQLPDVVLPPGGFHQIDQILVSNGLSLTNGYVRIERISGAAPYYAYAVINDQANSDGSFIRPVPENEMKGRSRMTLPAVVEANDFSTELVATNWSSVKKTLRCSYVADPIKAPLSTATFTINLSPQEQLILPDLVQRLRESAIPGIGPKGEPLAGAMFAEVMGGDLNGVYLAARTSTAGAAGGRYGLFYAAVPSGMATTGSAWVYGLQQTSETRSNLALVNTGETDGSADLFRIEIFNGETGLTVASFETTVNARAWKQVGSVLAQHAPGMTQGYARVTRIAGNNPFIAYAVINDGGQPGEKTGDGAFVASAP